MGQGFQERYLQDDLPTRVWVDWQQIWHASNRFSHHSDNQAAGRRLLEGNKLFIGGQR